MHDTHKRLVDIHRITRHTDTVDVHEIHTKHRDDWLTPTRFAEMLPGASPKSVRDWLAAGKVPGAIRLPSGRWRIPWTAVVEILGFDPRYVDGPAAPGSRDGA